MTTEKRDLSDQQIAIALKIIEVVTPYRAEDVLAAMVSIMSHAINETASPDMHAQYWANTLVTTVEQARHNGDKPYSGGAIQ